MGVVPRLRSLSRDAPGVSLALSLHAPTQGTLTRLPKFMQHVTYDIPPDPNSNPNSPSRFSLIQSYLELRLKIVPTAKAWHIDQIMDALDFFIDSQSHVKADKRYFVHAP